MKRSHTLWSAVLCACMNLFLASSAGAVTLRVPSQYPTITAACQVAVAGDTVAIEPDVYDDERPYVRAGVTVRGLGHAPGNTRLDHGWMLLMAGPDTTLIENLRVVGYGMGWDCCVTNRNAGAVLQDMQLYNEIESALVRAEADITLRRCRLAPGSGGPDVGVFVLDQACSVVAEDCLFSNGAVGVTFVSAPSGSRYELHNCSFAAQGGGTSVWIDVYPDMTDFSLRFVNCIMYRARCYQFEPDTLEWRYNDFTLGPTGWPQCGTLEGNFSADPMFCQEWFWDYRIDWESPCHGGGEGGEDVGARLGYCNDPTASVSSDPPGSGSLWLSAPWPNPTTQSTTVVFRAADHGPVELRVLDVGGREVRRLCAQDRSGLRLLRWDGKDTAGRLVPAGAYYLQLRSGGEIRRQSVAVIR